MCVCVWSTRFEIQKEGEGEGGAPGEILIREGDEGDKFYIAEKGTDALNNQLTSLSEEVLPSPALGVLTYDVLCGCTPFAPNHESELMLIYENILGHSVYDTFDTPKDLKVNPLALDFIGKLLHPTPSKRLGSTLEVTNESKKLMNHEWFEKFDWKGLESGNLKSPLVDLLDQKPSVAQEDEYEVFEI